MPKTFGCLALVIAQRAVSSRAIPMPLPTVDVASKVFGGPTQCFNGACLQRMASVHWDARRS